MQQCLRLKRSNCRNCHKCIRSCPVKSIRFSEDQADIIPDECILCGHCFVVCPQNAKEIVDDTPVVKELIRSGAKVYASLAPSFIANYDGTGIESMRGALKKLGFYDAEETALGATIVKREYDRLLKEGDRDILISSCCHSVNLLIRKYFPGELGYLADVMSPMVAHCSDIKRRDPEAKAVFIGPCVAKKDEAAKSGGIVDAALTFEELSAWLEEANIMPEKTRDDNDESRARFFPTSGGILKTMTREAKDYTYMVVDGVSNCIAALKDIQNGGIHKCFIEMSACSGSCICGPVMEKTHRSPVRDYAAVASYAGSRDFPIASPDPSKIRASYRPLALANEMPTEEQIREIMIKMGKTDPSKELNCGTCGYDTCRDKAIAVWQNKAEINMCLPYLMERAASFSETIVNNSPNGLIVLDEEFNLRQINSAAKKMLDIYSSDLTGQDIAAMLDPSAFIGVLESGEDEFNVRMHVDINDKYVERTIVRDRENHLLICILGDVTDEEKERKRKEEISRQTAEVADKVVEKQMRIVQEIASLLGETTAETKVALTKLKESVENE